LSIDKTILIITLRNKINEFTFVGAFWPDPVLVLGRSTVVGDSGDVFTGVVAVHKIKYINNEKRHKQNHNQNWKTMSMKLTAVGSSSYYIAGEVGILMN